jgi:hypothetical protein
VEERVAARAAEGIPTPIHAKLDILQYRMPPRPAERGSAD